MKGREVEKVTKSHRKKYRTQIKTQVSFFPEALVLITVCCCFSCFIFFLPLPVSRPFLVSRKPKRVLLLSTRSLCTMPREPTGNDGWHPVLFRTTVDLTQSRWIKFFSGSSLVSFPDLQVYFGFPRLSFGNLWDVGCTCFLSPSDLGYSVHLPGSQDTDVASAALAGASVWPVQGF